MRISLVQRAHEAIREVIRPGDIAVDATVGNGHDTRFLAEAVGPRGRVYGFDIQAEAVESARERLAEAGLEGRVKLLHRSHGEMDSALDPQARGRVRAVMFNLGYLPGSDKRVITASESTLAALNQSLALLDSGGRISVLAYIGHPGGREEADAVIAWAGQLEADLWEVAVELSQRPGAPELILVTKKRAAP
jgi:predicted methyltransferase